MKKIILFVSVLALTFMLTTTVNAQCGSKVCKGIKKVATAPVKVVKEVQPVRKTARYFHENKPVRRGLHNAYRACRGQCQRMRHGQRRGRGHGKMWRHGWYR